jgi:phosphohistidine phosphatase
MEIYLIRHAHAEDGTDDAARVLSEKGQRQIRKMAAQMRRGELLEAREFWHSPLVRSRDTARLLAGRVGGGIRLVEVKGMEPYADPAGLARKVQKLRQSVAIVGHEPHLSALASLLLTGRSDPPLLILKKGAVAALEGSGRHWALRWLVSPKEL